MTDLIFLLLIFFMLTSSFVTPSGLPVNLPSSQAGNIEVQKASVTVTRDLIYFVNDKRVTKNTLEAELKRTLSPANGVVVLHIDKSVPTEELVFVAGIATALKAKVTIATKPK
jgi:biopolymer transport protein ExbD